MKRFEDIKVGERVFIYDFSKKSVKEYNVVGVSDRNNLRQLDLESTTKVETSYSTSTSKHTICLSVPPMTSTYSYKGLIIFASCNRVDYNMFSAYGVSKMELDKALFDYREERRENKKMENIKKETPVTTYTKKAVDNSGAYWKKFETKTEPAKNNCSQHHCNCGKNAQEVRQFTRPSNVWDGIDNKELTDALNDMSAALNRITDAMIGNGRRVMRNSLLDLLFRF